MGKSREVPRTKSERLGERIYGVTQPVWSVHAPPSDPSAAAHSRSTEPTSADDDERRRVADTD